MTLAEFAQHKTLIMVTHRSVGLELVDVVYSMEQVVLIETLPRTN